MNSEQTYDYIIVGGGTAGCVLANRLSKDSSNSVLLLEAGGKDNYIWVHVPVGYLYCMGNPRTDWSYKTTADEGLNGRSLNYPRGRILGGCSSINGMIYMRGQSADYDNWRQLGNEGWGWDDILPYFKKSEDYYAGPDEMHNTGGEWRVEKQRLSWDILDKFRDACEEAGIEKISDFNSGNNEGSSYFRVNQRAGWRWNTSKAFLRPAKSRKNLTIVTHAQVERVQIENGRATGVIYKRKGKTFTATSNKEVLLAAGAISSPQLLQLSGIGNPQHLKDLGIDVVHNLPGVGENLQDHLQIRCAYKVTGIKTLNENTRSLYDKLKIGLEYVVKRSGPMSMAPSQLGVFTKSDPSLATPDLEYHIQPLSLEKFGVDLDPYPAFTASVCHLRPESRGHVRIVSKDPLVHPDISPNYLSSEHDRLVAARAIRITRNLVSQKALSPYNPEEFRPGTEFQSDEELAVAAGNVGTTIFHPVGTAKMGNDKMAVVDYKLQVHGIKGLRVIDASIMPTITSGNTNSPVIMIAEKAADMILNEY